MSGLQPLPSALCLGLALSPHPTPLPHSGALNRGAGWEAVSLGGRGAWGAEEPPPQPPFGPWDSTTPQRPATPIPALLEVRQPGDRMGRWLLRKSHPPEEGDQQDPDPWRQTRELADVPTCT